ncbi:MAG: hypothetical protein WCB36_08720 [Burkholderiales bacterium]
MRFPRWLQIALFCVVLLFAQQAATTHAMAHAFQSQSGQQEQDPPSAKACSQCMALAEIQSAIPAGHAAFAALPLSFIGHRFSASSALQKYNRIFSARAPPVLL